MFNNLGLTAVDESTVEEEREYVEGGSKRMGQGAQVCVIDMAYQVESQNGAIGVAFKVHNEEGQNKNFTLYATSGTEKGQKMTYTFTDREGNQKTQFMKGYLQIRAIVYAALGVDETNPSRREIDIHDWDLKKDVKSMEEVYMDLVGKPVILMFREKLVDDWKDTQKSAQKIELEHAANAMTKLTRAEARKGETEPKIHDSFLTAIEKDPVLDKRKDSKGTPAPSGGGNTGGGTESASF